LAVAFVKDLATAKVFFTGLILFLSLLPLDLFLQVDLLALDIIDAAAVAAGDKVFVAVEGAPHYGEPPGDREISGAAGAFDHQRFVLSCSRDFDRG
jgi:hypothetical protein